MEFYQLIIVMHIVGLYFTCLSASFDYTQSQISVCKSQ